MQTSDTHRMWKAFVVSPESLVRALMTGEAWYVVEGIPRDARLVGYTFDPISATFRLMIEHHSYPQVHPAEYLPEVAVTCVQLITKERWEKIYEHNKDIRPGELFVLTQGKHGEMGLN